MSQKKLRYSFLFAGGGTGGHFFPAAAVAQQIKKIEPESKIYFVGLKDKIEGTKSQKYGFEFYHLYIYGLSRNFAFKNLIKNLLLPIVFVYSFIKGLFLTMKLNPSVVIGSGGYSSFIPIICGRILGKKIILLEQNSYPGLSTRLLEKYADKVYINFEDAKEFLRFKEKIEIVGNPVRINFEIIDKSKALEKFNLNPKEKTVLVLGGSLGAQKINEIIKKNLLRFKAMNIQLIWQTGKRYYENYREFNSEKFKIFDFIDDMNSAYSAVDAVIARAGATTLAEIIYYEKPSIIIPSPNVAENHQYYNGLFLEKNSAAIMVKENEAEAEAEEKLISALHDILNNSTRRETLQKNLKKIKEKYSKAAEIIANKIIEYSQIK